MKRELGGEDLIRFVDEEYAARASVAFASLKIKTLTAKNICSVFQAMMPLMYPA